MCELTPSRSAACRSRQDPFSSGAASGAAAINIARIVDVDLRSDGLFRAMARLPEAYSLFLADRSQVFRSPTYEARPIASASRFSQSGR